MKFHHQESGENENMRVKFRVPCMPSHFRQLLHSGNLEYTDMYPGYAILFYFLSPHWKKKLGRWCFLAIEFVRNNFCSNEEFSEMSFLK